MKFLLASLKHLLILKIVPKAVSNFCSAFPLLSLVDFFQCTSIAGYHRWVSEQLLEAQAEQAL
jgi:hypothetical protein